ncbi:MAG: hypothetical protein QOI59_6119 [Gammaproteobacteria bacterium]|jgi:hypothetical protein|nr:hypothetical protein [Gammaproteobacteria bacterium]
MLENSLRNFSGTHRLDIDDCDPGTALGESKGNAPADAGAAARHDCHLII